MHMDLSSSVYSPTTSPTCSSVVVHVVVARRSRHRVVVADKYDERAEMSAQHNAQFTPPAGQVKVNPPPKKKSL